ncbi:MAG: PAS domain-containing protein [bacterium]|nr:PAS domain-containing protein [bacterium]
MIPTATIVADVFLVLAAVSAPMLGLVVLFKNPHNRTHRAFGVLAFNIMLWTIGVLFISHSMMQESALFWLRITFCIACFLPATFFNFIGLFPGPRFEGPRWFSISLYVAAVVLSFGAFTDWYIVDLYVSADSAPRVAYGPVFFAFVCCIGTGMLFAYPNLYNKRKRAAGIARRQIDHVLLGIICSTFLASFTNVFAPAFLNVQSLEPYGPVFMVLLVAFFTYAMVRYHLLDIWVIISRTTVHAVSIGFVTVTFLGMVYLVHWVFQSTTGPTYIVPTALAALVIALVLQPLRERVELILNRTLLKRRYDLGRLLARAGKNAARIVKMDELLETVCKDISETIGVRCIRVLLVDENDARVLVTEYSSIPDERGTASRAYGALLEYARLHPDPLILEAMIHSHIDDYNARIVEVLAELDAYMCVPLPATSGLVGLLALGPKTSRDIYTSEDLVAFTAMAIPLATAIENSRLYRKLEEANLHLARVLSNMRGAVVAVKTDGTITTTNDAATEILGPLSLGQHMDKLTPAVAGILQQTLDQRRGLRDLETVIEGPEGEPLPVVMSSSCLTTSGDELTGAMVMIYDLTQVKRLERNVQRAHRLSSIGTLAAGMAHEIKNPLVSIKTFSQLLPARYEDLDFRNTFTEVVPNEVERIDSIVSRLLDFARPKPVSFAPQDLRAIIEEVLLLVENQTRKQSIRVETGFPEEGVDVFGDEQQLHQVFLNLVLNAIDAMRQTDEGVLRIDVGLDRMYLRRNGSPPLVMDCVKVAVTDSGIGIGPDGLDRVFTPFFTTKETGTGLGLAVVHGIVTEHGGEVDVRSAANQGTTFTVSLPMSKP